ncbi:MAG: HEPN domain-containing protein [Verrucomicrobia bacterium]|nr:HEPN domain-containing protein [Verrucomicrobiota bacterium]
MPRKTDSNNPADWLWIAESYLEALRLICERQVGYQLCRSKLAEVLEKMIKAELIRNGWSLEKTHDLEKLLDHLKAQASDLVGVAEPLCDALGELYFIDRYPGFDLEDPDWPTLRQQIESVSRLLFVIQSRLPSAGS